MATKPLQSDAVERIELCGNLDSAHLLISLEFPEVQFYDSTACHLVRKLHTASCHSGDSLSTLGSAIRDDSTSPEKTFNELQAGS
jgi:hypothetical protein